MPHVFKRASLCYDILMKIIDVHTHGIGGYDTKSADAGHLLKIAEIHGSHGVSAIIPAIYPAPINVMRDNLAVIREAMNAQKAGNPSFKTGFASAESGTVETPRPAAIIGAHLEGPFLNPSKCGSLNATTFLNPRDYHLFELVTGFEDIIKIITVAPELSGARQLIKRISDIGIIVNLGHSNATYAETEAGHKAGARSITHLFNAMRQYHHREPGITGYGLINPDIYVEVIADPFHLHPAALDLIFRAKKRERIILVSDSIRETKAPAASVPGTQGLADPHGRLLGGAMTIPEAADALSGKYDRQMILDCISTNPARYLSR
jgi:N-acetylglucosamine-6-phosphate deacetylase